MTDHPVCFVDTETLGLDPERHPIWEVAVISNDDVEHLWHIDIPQCTIKAADPIALDINGFRDRYRTVEVISPRESARRFADLSAGLHLAGAVVSFDEQRLRLMHNTNLGYPIGKYPWHYHVIDVEALAIGFLAARGVEIAPPWKSDQLSEALGFLPPGPGERHTALADARWAKDIYEAIL